MAHLFRRPTMLLLATALLCLLGASNACVYMFGTSPDSVAPHAAGTQWDYSTMGENWVGVDGSNNSWTCATGTQQSPIDFPAGPKTGKLTSDRLRTKFSYSPLISNGTNLQVFNSGHVIQVQWKGNYTSKVMIPFAGMDNSTVLDVVNLPASMITSFAKATPLQFHFHTRSEHMFEGVYNPLEMHIVHNIPQTEIAGCPSTGCLAVVGIMFKEVEQDNPAFQPILDLASMTEGSVVNASEGTIFDIMAMLPKKGKSAYLQYSGSLTTPPCSEGLLWHVFTTPVDIGKAQMDKFMSLISFKSCTGGSSSSEHASRKLHDHDHDHSHEHVTSPYNIKPRTTMLETGESMRRTLLQEAYTCTLAAYGYNHRRVQPINDRKVKRYRAA